MSNRLLYDDLLALYKSRPTADVLKPLRDLGDAVVFRIDNVAEYFMLSSQENWFLAEDAPNLAPPFETFWMEWKSPKEMVAESKRGPNSMAGLRQGLYFRTQLHKDDTVAKWEMAITFFSDVKNRKGIAEPSTEWRMLIAEDGKIARDNDGTLQVWVFYSENYRAIVSESFRLKFEREPTVREWQDISAHVLWPGLLALSFLHCKNVEMIENTPSRLPLTKKRAQHPPRVKYYTLNIKPMQRILEDEGQANKTGLKLALHICRGHFKDFSKGSGLFGKFKGLYWWDSQIRGKRKYGEVVKNYQVQSSQKEKAK